MLKNLQEIMGGDVTHALVRLWSDELSETEAMAIHTRVQRDPKYREELDSLHAAFASIKALAGDRPVEAIVRDHRRLLQKRRGKRRFALGMAAGVVLALGAVVVVFSPDSDDRALPMYFSRIGEQQTIELGDGSVITLNTASQLVVDYSGAARRVLLERGEAYFEVAEDHARPFTVDLGTHAVTALGTAFNVRKAPERYQVAVIEGAVAVHAVTADVSASPPPVSADGQAVVLATPGPRRVEAGWVAEFDVSGNELTAFQPESMDRYQDWRSGMLTFDREQLYQVIQELNRYSRKKILIEDASIRELTVYTTVSVNEIDAALKGLEKLLAIKVRWHYDRIVITGSAAN